MLIIGKNSVHVFTKSEKYKDKISLQYHTHRLTKKRKQESVSCKLYLRYTPFSYNFMNIYIILLTVTVITNKS